MYTPVSLVIAEVFHNTLLLSQYPVKMKISGGSAR